MLDKLLDDHVNKLNFVNYCSVTNSKKLSPKCSRYSTSLLDFLLHVTPSRSLSVTVPLLKIQFKPSNSIIPWHTGTVYDDGLVGTLAAYLQMMLFRLTISVCWKVIFIIHRGTIMDKGLTRNCWFSCAVKQEALSSSHLYQWFICSVS